MTTRANFQGLNDGLHAEEITWEEYLSVCAGSLANATLEPVDPNYKHAKHFSPATVVTLKEEQNNGR